jgi:HTH-type transcriptional regulator, competence development regulator
MEQTLGQEIKQRRAKAKHSQRTVAKAIGIDFTYLSKIENDKSDRPSEAVLIRFAELYGGNAEDLLLLAGHYPVWMKDVIFENRFVFRDVCKGLLKND